MNATFNTCWHRLLPVLAALLVQTVFGQGIIYVHAPLSSDNGNLPPGVSLLPWDYLGTQVGPDYSIVINGQTVATLFTPIAVGQPSAFVIQSSSTSAIIGQQPFSDFPDDVWVVPLLAGTEIGPDAVGYNWFDGNYDQPLFTAARDSGIVGQPPLTVGYFTGLESAYLGFDFQQDGETYYGWIRVGCPVAGLNVGWVYDYAYETIPNIPIAAGAVPEPSANVLAILGIGLIIFRFARKAHSTKFKTLKRI